MISVFSVRLCMFAVSIGYIATTKCCGKAQYSIKKMCKKATTEREMKTISGNGIYVEQYFFDFIPFLSVPLLGCVLSL